MPEEPTQRVSDTMLSSFIEEQRQHAADQREHNRIMNLRQDHVENLVIGPPKRGMTGAPILNGDGLPVRDESKGLAGRKTWRLGIVPTLLQLIGLATAVIVLINALGP